MTVTVPNGGTFRGTLDRLDDFGVSLREADGRHRSFRTAGTGIKVEVHDPLASHKEMLKTYNDDPKKPRYHTYKLVDGGGETVIEREEWF